MKKQSYTPPMTEVETILLEDVLIKVSKIEARGANGDDLGITFGGGGDGTAEHGGAPRASGTSLWDEFDNELR